MSQNTVLVIDDSATIRKLVDAHLSSAGYRVVLAADAEEGLRLAAEVDPDLILLDHQLPGTTGHNVALQLAESAELKHIPVIISSTLRKKAYAEYIELDNVVDMLPKPYTEELLQTTVANAIETAVMIVNSQSQGSAVPETINIVDEAALTGNLAIFSLREVLDFLNNGRKPGVLEVEAERTRIRFHLDRGRIQGVYAHGITPAEVEQMVSQLPPSLASLAPVLRMTVSGRSCAEVDGFVQLLDQKVLDPRLMSKLMRFQAAYLVRFAFTQQLSNFRFETGQSASGLQKKLPLDISLLALLVEGALYCRELPEQDDQAYFARRAIRGQNLDRAGLSARHMKIFNALSEPKALPQLVEQLAWDEDELRLVMHGFELAELVERRQQSLAGQFIVFETDAAHAQQLRDSLEDSGQCHSGKVVRDKLALQLVLKRMIPDILVFTADDTNACKLIKRLIATQDPRLAQLKLIAVTNSENHDIDWQHQLGFQPHDQLERPYAAEKLFAAMDRLLQQTGKATETIAEVDAESPEPEPVGAES